MDTPEGKERMRALEVKIQGMDGLPDRMTRVEAELGSLKGTVYREIDGVREQQKAHKAEVMGEIRDVKDGLAELKDLASSGKSTLRALLWVGGATAALLGLLPSLWNMIRGVGGSQ